MNETNSIEAIDRINLAVQTNFRLMKSVRLKIIFTKKLKKES